MIGFVPSLYPLLKSLMKKDNIEVVSKALRIYFLAGALIAAIGLFVLLWIPTDPKMCG